MARSDGAHRDATRRGLRTPRRAHRALAVLVALAVPAACTPPEPHAARTLTLAPPAAAATPGPATDGAAGAGAAAVSALRHGRVRTEAAVGPCTTARLQVACALEAARDALYRRPGRARPARVFLPGTPVAAGVARDLRILRRHRARQVEVGQRLDLRVTEHAPGRFTVLVREWIRADRVLGPHGKVLVQRSYRPALRRFNVIYVRGGPHGFRIADVSRIGAPVVTRL